jgi:hypothetical protein
MSDPATPRHLLVCGLPGAIALKVEQERKPISKREPIGRKSGVRCGIGETNAALFPDDWSLS